MGPATRNRPSSIVVMRRGLQNPGLDAMTLLTISSPHGRSLPIRPYECEVVHERLIPRRSWLFATTCSSWTCGSMSCHGSTASCVFSVDRFNAYTFRIDDPSGSQRASTAEFGEGLLEQHGVRLATDCRIRLVTLPRMAGYIFLTRYSLLHVPAG